MSQVWKIINIDKREVLQTNNWKLCETLGNEGGFLFFTFCEVKWAPLTKIMTSLEIKCNKQHDGRTKSLGTLQRLPFEVIGMIFSKLDSLSDVFCLGAANTRLIILGEKRLRALMPHTLNWKGDRLICFRDDTKEGDLPEGILTREYRNFLHTPPVVSETEKNCAPASDFASWVTATFRSVDLRFMDSQKPALLRNFRNCKEWDCSLSTYMKYGRFCDKLTYSNAIVTQTDVLWNLSKRVYVRSKVVLAEFAGLDWVIDEDKLMGTILLIQICRASNNATKKKSHCGKWAGNRFEFTGKEILGSRLKEGDYEWKDVSKAVVKLFVTVSKNRYGKNWKECMRTRYCL